MMTFLFILAVIVVIVFTALSFYTSVNSGAAKLEKWLRDRNKKRS